MSVSIQEALKSDLLTEDYPVTVLLIDDQAIIGEAVRRMLKDEKDIVFHFCSDPTKAIDMAREVLPTVILQDLVMPDVDGLTLVRYFRANKSTKDVPMIVLSSKEDPVVKAKAFEVGANDYLVKLPDKVELIARIRYHSQGYIGILQRNEAYLKLEENQRVLMEELAEAAGYVQSLLPPPCTGDVDIEWVFIPSTQLGGDSFGYHWIDDENLAIYLLDVCGHGVGAALLSISAMNAINSRSLPDTNFLEPSEVLSSLNDRFPMEEHNNKFFTMWYGVYNKKGRVLKHSSGGHPPMVLITGKTREDSIVKELKTPGMVIGAMPDVPYVTDSCSVEEYGRLYVFCDGVYEIAKPDGSWVELPEFIKAVTKSPPPGVSDMDRIVKWSRDQQGGVEMFEDDFSILGIQFN